MLFLRVTIQSLPAASVSQSDARKWSGEDGRPLPPPEHELPAVLVQVKCSLSLLLSPRQQFCWHLPGGLLLVFQQHLHQGEVGDLLVRAFQPQGGHQEVTAAL